MHQYDGIKLMHKSFIKPFKKQTHTFQTHNLDLAKKQT